MRSGSEEGHARIRSNVRVVNRLDAIIAITNQRQRDAELHRLVAELRGENEGIRYMLSNQDED
jgi:hypothetical protein